MAQTDGDSPPQRLEFGRFVLDRARGCLLADGNEVPLRPKTFAVLRYLAERPGQLVAKDELFEAVWAGLMVTGDAPVQSSGEPRRARGAPGARLIIPVPRRGYRFGARAAPRERRRAPGVHALRRPWMYGILLPLATAGLFVAIWLFTSREVPES